MQQACTAVCIIMGIVILCEHSLVDSQTAKYSRQSHEPHALSEEERDIMNIMPWGSRWHNDPLPHWYADGLGMKAFQSCPEHRCRLVNNLSQSHAVLISHRFLTPFDYPWIQNFQLPVRPNYDQKWVFFTLEAPQYCPVAAKYHRLFNATFTYRKSSDVFFPFGKTVYERHQWKPISQQVWSEKDKNVAWIVSHCQTDGGREYYARDLAEHIDVTIYGKCGAPMCPQNHAAMDNDPCIQQTLSRFKFYLAFENSLCEDYVTEKLWRTLKYDIIPVVYGHVNYTHFLPRNSFIDVRDYTSPKHLAHFLKTVAQNKTMFDSFFEWRKVQKVLTHPRYEATCSLCEYLHKTKDHPPKTVDLSNFWGAETSCLNRDSFLRNLGVDITSKEQLFNATGKPVRC